MIGYSYRLDDMPQWTPDIQRVCSFFKDLWHYTDNIRRHVYSKAEFLPLFCFVYLLTVFWQTISSNRYSRRTIDSARKELTVKSCVTNKLKDLFIY